MSGFLERSGRRMLAFLQRGRPDPLTSVVLTVPVFLTYHLGILLIETRNGVDLISELTFVLLERSVVAYVAATLAVAGALLFAVWLMRKRGRLRPADPAMVVAESLTWAAIMLTTVGTATQRVSEALGATASAVALSTAITTLGPVDKLVMAAGAGFHEEIVFRAGLLSGGAALLSRVAALGRGRALVLAVLVSSVAFALVHHLGPFGETFAFGPFVFRTLAGVFLGVLFLVRGFAIAVYTHALYDVLVFFIL